MVSADAVMEFKNGLNFSADQVGSGIPVVGVGDFGTDFRLPYRELGRVEVSQELSESYYLRNEDLLFCRSNGNKALVGRVLYVDGIEEQTSHSGFTIRGRVASQQLIPLFAAYYFSSALVKEQFLTLGGGTNISNLSQSMLKSVKVPLPPLSEQKKIVAILSTWDRAIELIEKLIATKQKRKRALMQQLLTGKVRFSAFVKSQNVFETRYGNYPKDWKYVRIENVANQVSVKNIAGEKHQVLSCTKYDGLVDSLTYFGKQIFSDNLSTYKIVPRNHFAYATNHIEEGSIGYQDVCETAVISPMYTVFNTKDIVDDNFLYKLLKSDLYVHIYKVSTSASVDRRGSLRWKAFSHIRIPLPSLEEQQAIAAVLDCQQEEIDILKRKLAALKQQKKGLMQQLLAGRKRVEVKTNG